MVQNLKYWGKIFEQGFEMKKNILEGKTILFVDDLKENLELFSNMITPTGAHVLLAQSVMHALTLFKTNDPDLVITDVYMPEKNGFELIAELQSIQPKTKIIAVSGGTHPQDLKAWTVSPLIGVRRVEKSALSLKVLISIIEESLTE